MKELHCYAAGELPPKKKHVTNFFAEPALAGRCGQLVAAGVSVLLARSCLHVGGPFHLILFLVYRSSSFSLGTISILVQ
jgi:hypothetical protein